MSYHPLRLQDREVHLLQGSVLLLTLLYIAIKLVHLLISFVCSLTMVLIYQNPRLVLIHIPLRSYSFFLQPILRLLFGEDHDEDAASIPWTNRHDFLNVSITPVECSVICTRDLAERFFRPLAELYNPLLKSAGSDEEILIGKDDYIVIQVEGQGLEAGQRVLELTSPLAMAGM
jgi:hypothetical protein